MITKVAKRKKNSSFKRLAAYILKQHSEHVEYCKFTNCEAWDMQDAVREIIATQDQQQNTKADKTYHLIVAFPIGEQPSSEILTEIENELVKSIGMQDHQRISAVHQNTAHHHLHIAINKIHPKTLRLAPLKNDYRALRQAAKMLEKKYGLQGLRPQHTNPQEITAELQKRLIPAIENTLTNWHELHDFLNEFDLKIIPAGRGLHIANKAGTIAIKPSAIDRNLSRGNLEKRFGPFLKKSDANGTPNGKPVVVPEAVVGEIALAMLDPGATWQTIHELLERAGLRIAQHKRALIIAAEGRAHIPSIDLGAQYAKSRMEAALGPFAADNRPGRGGEAASTIERAGKVESFESWALREITPIIRAVLQDDNANWATLHQALAAKGVRIAARGRGLIIHAQKKGQAVKPSTLGRDLSRANLEKRLGAFAPASADVEQADCAYRPEPKQGGSTTLWAEYADIREQNMIERKARFAAYGLERDREQAAIQAKFAALRVDLIHNPKLTANEIKHRVQELSVERQIALNKLRIDLAARRRTIQQETHTPTWRDWLIAKAAGGDRDALTALQNCRAKPTAGGNFYPSDQPTLHEEIAKLRIGVAEVRKEIWAHPMLTRQKKYELNQYLKMRELKAAERIRQAHPNTSTSYSVNAANEPVPGAVIDAPDKIDVALRIIEAGRAYQAMPNGDLYVGANIFVRRNRIHILNRAACQDAMNIAVELGIYKADQNIDHIQDAFEGN